MIIAIRRCNVILLGRRTVIILCVPISREDYALICLLDVADSAYTASKFHVLIILYVYDKRTTYDWQSFSRFLTSSDRVYDPLLWFRRLTLGRVRHEIAFVKISIKFRVVTPSKSSKFYCGLRTISIAY